MFDRVVCLAIRMAALPRVDSAALIALKTGPRHATLLRSAPIMGAEPFRLRTILVGGANFVLRR
jgi:hypothetical protein